MSKLVISETLSLPLDAVTQKFGILGRTGSGKSYFATKLCEEMLDAKAQIVALDPVGVWYGLRIGSRGHDGYRLPVFGGLHGDIPLEPGGGALIADLIVDKEISAVVDVSGFILSEQRRFATDFATHLFHRKKTQRSAIHVFFEEAQEFVPQQVRGDVAKMVGAFERLIKLGRNFGIGASLISQRPQSVNKDVLNQTECLFAFQMTGPQERKAIESWIAEKGLDKDIVGELPKLKVGEAYVWSPQWLQISERVKIAQKKTADVSSTPKPGVKPVAPKQLSQIELEDLSDKMLATIERAKAEDPKELRKQLAEVRGQLSAARRDLEKSNTPIKSTAAAKPDSKQTIRATEVAKAQRALEAAMKFIVEITTKNFDASVPEAEVRKAIDGAVDQALKRLGSLAEARQRDFEKVKTEASRVLRQMKTIVESDIAVKLEVRHNDPFSVAPPAARRAAQSAPRPSEQPAEYNGEEIMRPQLRILDALASLHSLGLASVSKSNAAVFAGASPKSSSYVNNLGRLRTLGLIHYPQQGNVALTENGAGIAKNDGSIVSRAELHRAWFSKLSNPKVRILEALIAAYPDTIEKEKLAAEAGASPTSSSYVNNLGNLRSLGLIDYPQRSLVAATDLLFPEGLP